MASRISKNQEGLSIVELTLSICILTAGMAAAVSMDAFETDPSSPQRDQAVQIAILALSDSTRSQCRHGAPLRVEARQKAIDDLSAYAQSSSMEEASMENTLARAERDCLMEKAQAVSWDF